MKSSIRLWSFGACRRRSPQPHGVVSSLAIAVILATILTMAVDSKAQEEAPTPVDESGMYYTIQKGDTLWDISQRFFRSPAQWPDLWRENSDIANPHWIYPGNRIRLYQPPQGPAPMPPAVAALPPPAEPDPAEPRERPYYLYSSIESIGFISEVRIPTSGTIFRALGNKQIISQGDAVFIRRPEPDQGPQPQVGQKFFTFRIGKKPFRDPETKASLGVQHYISGVIEITREEPDFLMAKVLKSFRAIKPKDLLARWVFRDPKIYLTPSLPNFEGRIIGTEEQTVLIGDNFVAFIDKGEEDGVQPGQWYSIFYQERDLIDPAKNQMTLLAPIDFGGLLVLHSEAKSSTVLITSSDKSIYPGMKFHTPEVNPMLASP